MIRLFINGLAASAGGGLTYLRNVIPHLAQRTDAETTVLLNPAMRREFEEFGNISFIEDDAALAAGRRFIREQKTLPKLVRCSGAQVLISAGNFALWRSPVPQILLSRNSLYTSSDFFRDVRAGVNPVERPESADIASWIRWRRFYWRYDPSASARSRRTGTRKGRFPPAFCKPL